MTRISLIAVCALLLAACVLDEPDVGPPLREACVNADSDPDTDVSYTRDIVPIFEAMPGGCLSCHAPNAPTPLGYEISGLDLSTYQTLRSGGQNSGTDIVIAGQPCDSYLVLKVTDGVPFGARMPLSGAPLDDVKIQLIRDWIAEGALDD